MKKLLTLFLCLAVSSAFGQSTLTVNKSTGAITGPVSATTFKTINSIAATNAATTNSAGSLSISGQTGLLTFTGLTSTNRAKTVRDAADTVLELGGSYTPTGNWTNMVLITPALGTPSALVGTSITGTASAFNIGGSAASLSITGQTGLMTVVGLTSTNRAKTVRDAADTVLESGGTYTPTGSFDFSGASATTGLKIPVAAGAAPTANGAISYDSTANLVKVGTNTATRTVMAFGNSDGGSPSGPLYTQVVGYKTGLSMLAGGNGATIFALTLPTGASGFTVTNSSFVVTAVNTPTAAAFRYNIAGNNGVMTTSLAANSTTPAANQVWTTTVATGGSPFFAATSGNVTVTITTPFTGTSVTGTLYVSGFFF
jgi:hypothetical protein